jgi:retron-type reverse transcriptase
MMNPTRNTIKPVDLCKIVRAKRNLTRAWSHVEKRVTASKDEATRKALAQFRLNPDLELTRISKALATGKFKFEKQRGYPKPRKGKPPRPIVIAPIVNRIVQRAILDLCQCEDRKVRPALGRLPAVIDCETSVGGLPGRGVPEAIGKIQTAIKGGAKWYVRSDLKNFFTAIPKSRIENFLADNIIDHAFVELFMHALATELENKDDILDDLALFPTEDLGVPQGSALSALCANIILSEFDKNLNGRNVTTIRYLDDFVILAPSKAAVEKTWSTAKKLLHDVGLDAHDPALQTGKASRGEISNGFVFLSFNIDHRSTSPSKEAQQKLLEGVRLVVAEAKREIVKAGSKSRRAQPMFVQSLVHLDKKIRGWGDAFNVSSHRVLFAQLDESIKTIIDDFIFWFGRHTKNCQDRTRMRKMGIALLIDS